MSITVILEKCLYLKLSVLVVVLQAARRSSYFFTHRFVFQKFLNYYTFLIVVSDTRINNNIIRVLELFVKHACKNDIVFLSQHILSIKLGLSLWAM